MPEIDHDAAAWLKHRIEWLMKEAHAGGDWQHLTARKEEAAYILQKMLPVFEQAKGLAEALQGALKSIEDSYDALKRGGGQVPLSLLRTMNACRAELARYEESKG